MSEVDQKLWASILSSKAALEDTREFWAWIRWIILGVQAAGAVFASVTGLGFEEVFKFMLYANVAMVINMILKLALARHELSIAKTEAELAYRLDRYGAPNPGYDFENQEHITA